MQSGRICTRELLPANGKNDGESMVLTDSVNPQREDLWRYTGVCISFCGCDGSNIDLLREHPTVGCPFCTCSEKTQGIPIRLRARHIISARHRKRRFGALQSARSWHGWSGSFSKTPAMETTFIHPSVYKTLQVEHNCTFNELRCPSCEGHSVPEKDTHPESQVIPPPLTPVLPRLRLTF